MAEQYLVFDFLGPSAQSSPSHAPDFSSVFVLAHTHAQEVRNAFLVLGKLPSLSVAILFPW